MSTEATLQVPPKEPRFTEQYGFDTGPVAVAGLADPDYFQQEVELIWKRQWIYAAKEHYIPEPGDYVVKELPFGPASIIIIRGSDGRIRAFHNVCSHRCNKVLWKESGNARRLRCEYHGWQYGTDGALKKVTDENMFFRLEKEKLGLTPVHCDTWNGFVFVNIDPSEKPEVSLRDYFGDFNDWLEGFPFQRLTREYKWRVQVNANWKLARDAFIEAYHIAYIHDGTTRGSYTTRDDPNIRALDMRCTKFGAQLSLAANPEYRPPPSQAVAFGIGAAAVQNVGEERDFAVPDSLNPTGALNWAGDLNMFFPSFGCPTFPGQYVLNHFMPIDERTTLYEAHVCVEEPRTASERWAQEVAQAMFISGIREDVTLLEFTQKAIESGAKKVMYLQDQELAVRQSHHLVQEICGPYPGAPRRLER